VDLAICTIGGFCGNDPGDLKWLGDKADSGIAPKNSGPRSPRKSIREQALAAHTSGISHRGDDVRPDIHGSTGGELVGRGQCQGLAFPMTIKVIQLVEAASPRWARIQTALRARSRFQFRQRTDLYPHARRFRRRFDHLPGRRIADEGAGFARGNFAQTDLQKARQHELPGAARMDRTEKQVL
jgi:hypothetical protein